MDIRITIFSIIIIFIITTMNILFNINAMNIIAIASIIFGVRYIHHIYTQLITYATESNSELHQETNDLHQFCMSYIKDTLQKNPSAEYLSQFQCPADNFLVHSEDSHKILKALCDHLAYCDTNIEWTKKLKLFHTSWRLLSKTGEKEPWILEVIAWMEARNGLGRHSPLLERLALKRTVIEEPDLAEFF
ncbi:hypothetical protein EDC01DRAFT_627823 [Geopyxis carbonaria]|nr:hypothetical protein EDC01DRAFT_627823 [Geopyxis carbonaria]